MRIGLLLQAMDTTIRRYWHQRRGDLAERHWGPRLVVAVEWEARRN